MNPAVKALPARSILIHIGPHKTGTTSIQAKLASARQQLREHGVVYPGPWGAHHAEARAFIGKPEGFASDGPALNRKAWRRLLRIARRSEETVLLSSEFFSMSTPEDLDRLVHQLDAERIHVLIAARNPGSLALSNWQQSVSSGNTMSLDAWLDERFRRDQPGTETSDFWQRSDPADLVSTWSRIIDPSRIHLIVVDESDRGLIPATFEHLLGLPEGLIGNQPVDAHNRSLTAPEVELVRATNLLTDGALSWSEFSLFFRRGMTRELLYTRSPAADETRLALPEWAATQATAEVESIITRLLESQVEIIGDIANLRRAPRSADAATPTHLPLELAAHGAAGVMKAAQQHIRRTEDRIKALEIELAEANQRRGAEDLSVRELGAHLVRRVSQRTKRSRS